MNRPPCFHGNSLLPDQRQTCCLNTYADRQTDGQTVLWVSINWVCFHAFTLLHFSSSGNLEIFDSPSTLSSRNAAAREKEEEGVLPLSQFFCHRGAAVHAVSRWHLSSAPIHFLSEFKNNNNNTNNKEKRRRRRRSASRVLVSIWERSAWVGVFAVRQW